MSAYEQLKQSLQASPNYTCYEIAANFEVLSSVREDGGQLSVRFITNFAGTGVVLHWGVGIKRMSDWVCPVGIGYQLPEDTKAADSKAARTTFLPGPSGVAEIEISFPSTDIPLQLNFVLNHGTSWFNNNSRNYSLRLRESSWDTQLHGPSHDFADDILHCEGELNSWTLMHRYNKCREWLDRADLNDLGVASWFYVWMRYSATRQLTWQRSFNTRPSELASSQKGLTYALAGKIAKVGKVGLVSPASFYRPILGSIGKGGDNGQRIRDQILEVMHRHKIPETNNHFYEQWHQKLHNNTTPDDVAICEAVIAFNETNDIGKYWATLQARGVDRHRLETFERPIRAEPYHFPQIIGDMKDYLKLLKSVHTSDDLMQLVGNARPFVSREANTELDAICANFYHFDNLKQIRLADEQMGRVSAVRHMISGQLTSSDLNALREVMYLDIALEAYVRQLSEKIVHVDIALKWRINELIMVLDNYRRNTNDEELNNAFDDWTAFSHLYSESAESNPQHALILKAALDRIARVLGRYIDQMSALLQPKAVIMAQACNIPDYASTIFAEESIRGSLLFSASSTLRKIDRVLRSCARMSPWQVISPGKKTEGRIHSVPNLHDIQLKKFEEATILVVNQVGGEEDIPDGVTGVVSKTELDTLAHVSVRARNMSVFLAVCFDESVLQQFRAQESVLVRLTFNGRGEVLTERIDSLTSSPDAPRAVTVLRRPLDTESVVITFDEFAEGRTGAKGNNCKAMRAALPEWIRIPKSCALPFGTCEKVMQSPENAEQLAEIEAAYAEIEAATEPEVGLGLLSKMQSTVLSLKCPAEVGRELKAGLAALGIEQTDFEEAWKTIKRVWGSKYNERAYVSTFKAGISLRDISMSVLCQEVVCGDYAFVLHTKNPITNNPTEVYGELVVGLGETLVGAYPGRALSFIADKSSDRFEILSFPNKSVALVGSGFIFRSDSNSEDLEGFAGAGLFDSFLMREPTSKTVGYARERALEAGRRQWLVGKMKAVGVAVEEAFGGVAQDIEGVILGENVVVVQSRPQV